MFCKKKNSESDHDCSYHALQALHNLASWVASIIYKFLPYSQRFSHS